MQLSLLLILNIANVGLGVIKQFLIIGLLNPVSYGLYNIYSVWINFGNYLDLSTNNGVLYKSLELNKEKKLKKSLNYRQVIFKFTLFISVIYVLIGILIVIFSEESLLNIVHKNILAALFFAAPILITHNLVIVECRIQEKFKLISASILIGTAISLLIFLLINKYRYTERVEFYVVITQLAVIVSTIIMIFNKDIREKLLNINCKMECNIILNVIKLGIPLTIQPILMVFHQSMDRIFYVMKMTSEQFGYYSFGAAIGSYLGIVASTIALKYSTEHMSKDISEMNLIDYIHPITIASIINGLICSIFIIFGQAAIKFILPQYGDGFDIIKNTLLAYSVLFPAVILMPMLMANKYKKKIIISQVVIIILFILFQNISMMSKGEEIYFPLITMIYNITIVFVLLINVFIIFKASGKEIIITTMKVYGPLLSMVFFVTAVKSLSK
jgi:O-antigen/teichoic acid export membrane protein